MSSKGPLSLLKHRPNIGKIRDLALLTAFCPWPCWWSQQGGVKQSPHLETFQKLPNIPGEWSASPKCVQNALYTFSTIAKPVIQCLFWPFS